jgi:hypothetical protein
MVTTSPSPLRVKAPARVSRSPAGVRMRKKPSPSMARSSVPPVCTSPPCRSSVQRPRASVIATEPPSAGRARTISAKSTPSRRKPVVETFAMLFATLCISRIRPDWRVKAT